MVLIKEKFTIFANTNSKLDINRFIMKYYDVPNEVMYKAFDDSWRLERATSFSGNISNEFYVLGRRMDYFPSGFGSFSKFDKYDIENVTRGCIYFLSNKKGKECTFEDFTKEYSERLKHYKWNSKEYYMDCYSICHMDEMTALNKKQRKEDNLVSLYTCLGLIASFFVLGGVAYVFKHIIAFFWYMLSNICILLFNIVIQIFCILFDLESPSGIVDGGNWNMVSPLEVWQIGGWIYGIFVVCVLIYQFFNWLGNHFANE